MKTIGLIIPFRDRYEHLDIFIPIIVNHLKNQNVNYKIVVINQNNKNRFNRSKLLNIGADVLFNQVDYFCFHDIDLIPENINSYHLNNNNIIHLTSYVGGYGEKQNNKLVANFKLDKNLFDKFKYKDTSRGLGGVTLMKKEIWLEYKWNDFFEGWGLEDDELKHRIEKTSNYKVIKTNYRYVTLYHKPNKNSNYNYWRINDQAFKIIKFFLKFLNKITLFENRKYKIESIKKYDDYDFINVNFPKREITFKFIVLSYLVKILKLFILIIKYGLIILFFLKIITYFIL